MKKPTVTIQDAAAAYLAGGALLVFSLVMLIPAISAPQDEKIFGWIMAVILFVCGLVALAVADSKYVIDENGIYYKGFSKEYRYPWTDIIELGIAKTQGGNRTGAPHPEIWITLKGGTPRQEVGHMWLISNLNTCLQLPYRRKVWDCIRHYYGEPNFDEWGKPPTMT